MGQRWCLQEAEAQRIQNQGGGQESEKSSSASSSESEAEHVEDNDHRGDSDASDDANMREQSIISDLEILQANGLAVDGRWFIHKGGRLHRGRAGDVNKTFCGKQITSNYVLQSSGAANAEDRLENLCATCFSCNPSMRRRLKRMAAGVDKDFQSEEASDSM
jgi:hypothetical protein